MRKALASGAVAFMLVTGGATAASAQTTPNPNAATTEQKEDNSGKWGLLGLLGLAGLAGLARKKPDTRTVDHRGATSVGANR
jgi:MYXO-CTERM domain-containing protein